MILVMGALEEEIRGIREVMGAQVENLSVVTGDLFLGNLAGRDIALGYSGVGKVLSALACQAAITGLMTRGYSPKALFFTGVAGSINPELKVGDTLVSQDCVQHDMDATVLGIPRGQIPGTDFRILCADPVLRRAAAGFQSGRGTTKTMEGRILTGDMVIVKKKVEQMAFLREELEGDAVEMEGAAVALCAQLFGIPWVLLRFISDGTEGRTTINFRKIMKVASENNLELVRYMLGRLD